MNEKTKLETELQREECKEGRRSLIVFCGFLIVVIIIGGYYFFLEHDELEQTKEALQRISLEYELVKDERDLLEKELSNLRKTMKKTNFQEASLSNRKH